MIGAAALETEVAALLVRTGISLIIVYSGSVKHHYRYDNIQTRVTESGRVMRVPRALAIFSIMV
jgi:hypothetical protein